MKILRQMLLLLLVVPMMAQTAAKSTGTPIPEMPNAVTICSEALPCVLTSSTNTAAVYQFGAGTTWCQTFTGPTYPVKISYTNPNTQLCPYDPAPGVVKGLVAQQTTAAYTVGFTISALPNTKVIPALAPAVPVITWPPPLSVPSGTVLSAVQLNAIANTPGTFVYTPAAGTVLSTAGTMTLATVFTPTDTVHFTTAKASVPLTVTGKTALTTFPATCTTYSDNSFNCLQTGPAVPAVTQ